MMGRAEISAEAARDIFKGMAGSAGAGESEIADLFADDTIHIADAKLEQGLYEGQEFARITLGEGRDEERWIIVLSPETRNEIWEREAFEHEYDWADEIEWGM